MAVPTLGFETIATDRTTSVSVADDADALLGIDETGNTPDQQTDVDVIEITNNAAEDFTDLSTAVTIDDPNGALGISSPFDASLAQGATTGLEMTCDGGGDGTATVTVVSTASGSTVAIRDHEFSETIDYSCTGGGGPPGDDPGPAEFTASDVDETESPPSQTFTFDAEALGNKATATIDLTDPQQNGLIDYTSVSNSDIEVVSGQNTASLSFDPSTNEITYEPQGNVGGTIEIRIENFEITSFGDGTIEYSDSTGRSDGDSFSVMAVADGGESVETSGDAVVPDGETASEVEADGDVDVGETSNVNDEIDAGGDVSVEDSSSVSGEIEADGDVEAGDNVNLNGELDSGGSASLGDEITAGEVSAGDDVTVGSNSNVNGEIETDGGVTIGSGSLVESVDADEAVTVEGGTVNGDLDAGGDVYLEDGASMNGEIETDGTVYVGCSVTLNGEVDADGGRETTC